MLESLLNIQKLYYNSQFSNILYLKSLTCIQLEFLIFSYCCIVEKFILYLMVAQLMCHVFYGLVFGNRLHKNFKRFENPMNQQNHQEYRQSGPLCTPKKRTYIIKNHKLIAFITTIGLPRGLRGGRGLFIFSCYSFFLGKE